MTAYVPKSVGRALDTTPVGRVILRKPLKITVVLHWMNPSVDYDISVRDTDRRPMKRSEINQIIRKAETFIRAAGFHLPPFANWSKSDWQSRGVEIQEITEHQLGWDVTDFGLGDFADKGVLLFTIRNGTLAQLARGTGKVYCEKILVCQPNQLVLHHFHKAKTEDIINRAGGRLEILLQQADHAGHFNDHDLTVSLDGVRTTVKAGGIVILEPGESITLEPYQSHQFRALDSTVLVGEVSTVNDDANDNFFFEPVGRFPHIDEDEAPYRLLCTEYGSEVHGFGCTPC
jgi:D-lyxose ketol-isomerase